MYHLCHTTKTGPLSYIGRNARYFNGISRIEKVSRLLLDSLNSISSNGVIELRVFAKQMTKKILVVEDEPASLNILRYFLSHEGYEISGAKDGLEAMELLAQSQFDLVLSDVRMPRLDGVALAKHLLSALPITPVILMTGYGLDNMETVLTLGVPCLNKPLSLDQLLSQIQKVLEQQEKSEL